MLVAAGIVACASGCASKSMPVTPHAGPVYYALPSSLKGSDYVCTIDGELGHCVRVEEVRAFLASVRAVP